MICNLCPRKCGANRDCFENRGGYCKAPLEPVVARAALHFGEEPCISGKNGSGTVFFSGCSLSCVFCQNAQISQKINGKSITIKRLSEIYKELYCLGAENINLVTPTHYCQAICESFKLYKPPIPIVYNSGGYESDISMQYALKFSDVFLMDFKYIDSAKSLKYSNAVNYPDVAEKSILKCAQAVKENVYDSNGVMQKGLIIRHMVLPRATNDAIKIIDWVKENVPFAVLSLMSQYTPCGDLSNYSEIDRKITKREYDKVLDYAAESGLNVYVQELSSVGISYIPEFNLTGV